MVKIAFLLNSRVPSNDAHVLQSIRMCEAFAANGHEVVLHYPDRMQTNPDLVDVDITSYYDVDAPFETRAYAYPDSNYLYTALGRGTRTQSLLSRAFFTLYVTLRMRLTDADVYYTRGCFLAALLVALGLPTVFETHRTAYGGVGERLVRWFADKPALRGVVTLTDETAANLRGLGVPAERILVAPDGVKLDAYDDPLSKAEARDRLGLPADEYIVGYTGSLDRGKGVHDLVRATADLDVTIVVVGGRQERMRAAFRSYLDDHGIDNVELVGHVPPEDVPRYQWAADLLALPARRDVQTESHHPESTSPLKLFEYMAAGRPIVATRLPGIEAVLTHDESGALVEADDHVALREAIEWVRANPERAAYFAAHAARAVDSYRWTSRARRIVDDIT